MNSVVLIVDDDETTRVLASRTFARHDLDTLEAVNGSEAIGIFKEKRVDLVLLDVEMPECDGFEVLRTIRSHLAGADLPVIMMTGHNDLDEITRAYDLGATDFVTKPVNWLILRERANYVLRASQSFKELQRSKERLDEAQAIARLGTWEFNAEGAELQCSSEFARIFQHRPENGPLNIKRVLARVAREDRARLRDAIEFAIEHQRGFDVEFRVREANGDQRVISSHASIPADSLPYSRKLIGTVQDITERTEAEDRIRFLAFHDNLTGVENQRMFRMRLNAALGRERPPGRSMALMFIDLDKFKHVNDTLGHAAGDALLQATAARLQSCVRASDAVGRPKSKATEETASVARLGGDEFTILLSEIANAQDAARVARRILDKLHEPVEFEGRPLAITTSIGIAIAEHDGEEIESLIRNADAAMYHAKELGGDNFQFYQTSMNVDSVQKLRIEVDLRRALELKLIQSYYQPRVDVQSGAILGAEALARWNDPDLGMISPGVFIPVAEDSGLILPLGEMMLQTAIERAHAWHGSGFGEFLISVNLSPNQLSSWDVAERTIQIVEASGIDPRRVELEITESALIQNEEEVGRTLRKFKDAGLRIALDDFGTGYSSMTYLKRFPVDTVKIDRSFVGGIGSSDEDEAIVEAILSIAKALRLTAVAEGIETVDQLQFLQDRGCDEFQGFLVSPAVSETDLEMLLTQERSTKGAKKEKLVPSDRV